MKFVYIKIVDDVGKGKANDFKVESNCHGIGEIIEFTFSLDFLNKRIFECCSGIKKIIGKWYDLKLNKAISRIYEKREKDLYIILPKSYMLSINSGMTRIREYILNMFSKHNFKNIKKNGNIMEHLDNYLEEALLNQGMSKHDAKLVLVYADPKKINYEVLKKLVENFKYLNLYINSKALKSYIKKIEEINKEYGSSISIVNKSIKSLNNYDICILFDINKHVLFKNYIPKHPYILDLSDNDNDKYNEYFIEFKRTMLYSKIDIKKLNYLFAVYGKTTVSYIMCKISGNA